MDSGTVAGSVFHFSNSSSRICSASSAVTSFGALKLSSKLSSRTRPTRDFAIVPAVPVRRSTFNVPSSFRAWTVTCPVILCANSSSIMVPGSRILSSTSSLCNRRRPGFGWVRSMAAHVTVPIVRSIVKGFAIGRLLCSSRVLMIFSAVNWSMVAPAWSAISPLLSKRSSANVRPTILSISGSISVPSAGVVLSVVIIICSELDSLMDSTSMPRTVFEWTYISTIFSSRKIGNGSLPSILARSFSRRFFSVGFCVPNLIVSYC